MGDVDWMQLLIEAESPVAVVAETYLRDWPTASRPVLVRCDDERDYVVKGRQAGRMVANDQIVARLGGIAGAPVGQPMLVELPRGLIDAEPSMAHMTAGLAHGTLFVNEASERAAYDHAAQAANRPRFAMLALLFGWMQAGDHQFIYENAPPHLVHSVDHGHFFPNGPDWTAATLEAAPPAEPDPGVVSGAGLQESDVAAAKEEFVPANNVQIAYAVAAPPSDWLTMEERVAMAKYLSSRRDVIF